MAFDIDRAIFIDVDINIDISLYNAIDTGFNVDIRININIEIVRVVTGQL